MRYCARCLYPENHPLHLVFDDEGVCSGCRVHEEKDALDWAERFERLKTVVEEYRSRSGGIYDCIVPVNGARDSYFIVHTVRNVLGLNPMLVSYNKQYNTPVGIRNLAYLRTVFDRDILALTVNPESARKITRATMRLLGSMYWHCLAGETVFPVQTAVRFKIPLIIWGAHQGVDQVGMFSHLDEVEMTRKYRKEHDLMGVEAEDLMRAAPDLGEDLGERELRPYLYPNDRELAAVGVRGIYLNNYIRWDTKRQHEDMIRLYGYETAALPRTFDTCNDCDSHHYAGVHDLIKFRKFGYGKALDHACREIRLKRLTREQGIELVLRHEAVEPPDLPLFLSWAGMGREEFDRCVDARRDPAAWARDGGGWRLLDHVSRHAQDPGVERARLAATPDCVFPLTPPRAPEQERPAHVLFGRGWAGAPRGQAVQADGSRNSIADGSPS